MPNLDQFPAEAARILRDLDRRLSIVETAAKTNPAVPIVKSTGSSGFTVSGSGSTPSAGMTIGVSDGAVIFRHADGSTETIPAPWTPGVAIGDIDTFTSPSNPGSTVTVAAYQALRDDCQSILRASLIALKHSLENAGLLST